MKNRYKILMLLFLANFLIITTIFAMTGSKTNKSSEALLYFAGQRNRSHFKFLKDANLAKYFAPDFVWDIRIFKDRAEFERMVQLLRRINPTIILGSYASACTTMPKTNDTFPPAKMPIRQCKPEWILRDPSTGEAIKYGSKDNGRCFLDMRQPAVRRAVISLSIARAKHFGLDAVCFDNCYWGIVPMKNFPSTQEQWSKAFMLFYEEAGKACHKVDLKCIVNFATKADKIPNAFDAISSYVDGMMTEITFHPNIVKLGLLNKELDAYRRASERGKLVLLFPSSKQSLQFALKKIRPLAMKHKNIYVCPKGKMVDTPLFRINR